MREIVDYIAGIIILLGIVFEADYQANRYLERQAEGACVILDSKIKKILLADASQPTTRESGISELEKSG